MTPLLKIREPEVLVTGLFPSMPANQLALWKEGENILFFDGRVEKLSGYTEEAEADAAIVAFAQAYADGEERVYYGTADKLYKWADGTQDVLGTGYTGTEWSLETFGTFLFATNNVDELQVWENTGSAHNVAGTNFTTAKVIRKLENHLLVFNTSIDEQEVRWCSKSNPVLWEPSTDNSAGGLPIRDLDSGIVAAEQFGDVIGFYSSNGFGVVQYVGGPYWFGAKKRLQGIGAVGKDAIVPVVNEHYGFSSNGIFRNNGVSFAYVDTPAIKRWIKDNADPAFYYSVRGTHYQSKDLCIWSFMCKDSVRRAVGYNYKNQSWTIFLLPAGAFDEAQVIEGEATGRPLIAIGNKWGFFDEGVNAGNAALPARVRTNSLDAGDMDRWKLWDMVRFEMEQTGACQVRFGFGETPGEPDYWTSWTALARENWVGQESIYLTIELRSTAVDVSWAITGLEIFGSLTAIQR